MLKGSIYQNIAIINFKDVWTCDAGASNHVTWSKKFAINVHESNMVSLRHAGEAVESAAVIDVPGVFTTSNRKTGMKTMLKKCSYSNKYNFNLLGLSRLILKQE